MAASINRNEICCFTLEALWPNTVPSMVRLGHQSGNWGITGKLLVILWGRNLTYLSFAGTIIGAVGTAVGHVKNSPPTEYAFAAVLGASFLGSLLCLKKLSDRLEEYVRVVQNTQNENQEYRNQLGQLQSQNTQNTVVVKTLDSGSGRSASDHPAGPGPILPSPSAPPMEGYAVEVTVVPEPA